jgi:hypothetical protein
VKGGRERGMNVYLKNLKIRKYGKDKAVKG